METKISPDLLTSKRHSFNRLLKVKHLLLLTKQVFYFSETQHSLLQVSPTFLYPGRHLHIKDPAKLKQSAFSGQTDLSRHSFTSVERTKLL